MEIVFLLRHTYEYGAELEHECTKELGIYSSFARAEEAKRRYLKLEGFCATPEETFYICKYVIDRDSEWTEGFSSWEEVEQHQKDNNICRGDEYKKSIYAQE